MVSVRDVYNDVLSSESRYCASLGYLCSDYIAKIESKVNPRHLVDLSAAFALCKSLHAFHALLNTQLNQRAALAALLTRSLPSFRLYVLYAELYGKAVHAARHALTTSRKFKACVDKASSNAIARSSTGLSAATAHLLHASQSTSALLSGSSAASSLSASAAAAVPVSADLFVLMDVVLHRLPHYSRYLRDMVKCADCDAAERDRLLSAADKLDDLAVQTATASAGSKATTPQPLSQPSPHSTQRAAVVPLSPLNAQLASDDSSYNSLKEPSTPSSSTSQSESTSQSVNNALRHSSGLPTTTTNSMSSTPAPTRRRMSMPPNLTDGVAVTLLGAAASNATPAGSGTAGSAPPPLSSPVSSASSVSQSQLPLQSPISSTSPPLPPPTPLTTAISASSTTSPSSSYVSPSTSPASSSSSSSSSVFRYIPRIVLQRFLAIDSQLHKHHHTNTTSARRRTSLSLHNYLPSASSPTTPTPDCQTFPAAAILVADVSGFTKLNETFSVMEKGAGAEQVTTHLNRYFTALLNIIGSHGGDCVKFAGDALIVLFLPSREWMKREDGNSSSNGHSHSQQADHLHLSSGLFAGSSSALHGLAESEAASSGGSTRDLSASIARLADDHNNGGSGDYSSRGSGQFRFPLAAHNSSSSSSLISNSNSQRQKDKDNAHEQSTLQAETCLRAVQCALQLQQDMGTYKGDLVELEPEPASAAATSPIAATSSSSSSSGGGGHRRQRSELMRGSVELSLHIAIGCGTVFGFHVGGLDDEYEFVLSGSAFGQLKDGLDLSKRGEVVVSKQAWEYIEKRCLGQPCYNKQSKLCKSGDVRVIGVSQPIPLSPLPPLDLATLASHPFIPSALRAYVPRSVLDMLDAHANESSWLNEIRTVTCIFVNLRGLELSKTDNCNDTAVRTLLHKTCSELQRVIARHQGYRRQFLVDDKGTTLIVVFGVPPFAHEDDAYRGVKCAIEMRDSLLALGVAHGMGITTGTVYSGSVGSVHRQEHAVVGDIVNAAARIAGKAESGANGTILIDAATHDKTSVHFEMRLEGEITVKGKQTKIKIYTPIRHDRLAVMGSAATQRTTGETLNRGAEMAEFMQSLVSLQHDTSSSQPQSQSKVIMVEGEAGIGKTHLVRNFYRVVSTNLQTLHVVYAKGDATESSSLLGMWTPVMEQLMNLPPPQKGGAMVHKRTKQVHKFIKQVLPAHLANDPRLPYLNLVLTEPVQLPENELTKATKGQHKLMAKQAENVVYFLLQHAVWYERKQGKHTVMFAEDVHLMDASSVELLKRVAATIKPLLLVCSCRPPHKRPVAMASSTDGPFNSSTGGSGRKSGLGELSSPEVSVSGGSSIDGGSGSVGGMVDGNWVEEKENALEFVGDNEPEPSTISWKTDPEEKALDTSVDNSNGSAASTATITPLPVHRSLSSSSLDSQHSGLAASVSISSPAAGSTNAASTVTSTTAAAAAPSQSFIVDDTSVWGQHYLAFLRLPNLSHIQLSGLNQTTCTRLVCQRLHANSLDPQLSTLIFRRSRGNPLYAVEVASHLMEKGYLTLSRTGQCMVNPSLRDVQGRPMTVDEASLDLPVSLKGLVTRRLDSLPVMDLLVCKLASAFGYEEFERSMLVELCRDEGVDERQVSLSIHGLQHANILAVKEQKGGGKAGTSDEGSDASESGVDGDGGEKAGTLYFCHELVHSACYDLLVMSQKLRLHFKLATMELRRTKGTHQPSQQLSDNAPATTATADDGQSAVAGSEPGSPAESDADVDGSGGSAVKADSSGGGGFAKRLAARLGRRRGDDSTDGPTAATAASTAATASTAAVAVSGAELKRRASILTYHYTMAVRSHTPHAAGDSSEMRAFIREAKDYLSQRLVALPDEGTPRSGGSMQLAAEEALEAIKTVDSPALSPAVPPPPPPHAAWNEPATPLAAYTAAATAAAVVSPASAQSPASTASASGSSRPPPAPPASTGIFSGRRSWSGRQSKPAPPPTAALNAVPQSTPATNRQLFGRAPPPLPHNVSVPAPYIRSSSTASLTSSGLDSPARNFLAEPPPTSHPILPPPAMSPTGQSPSHTTAPSPTAASPLRSPYSPPPLPFASPTAAGSESSIHVTVAQLYSALASVGLSAELKDRVVAQLMGTTRNNYLPAVGASTPAASTPPPTVIRAGSLPPPLTHAGLGKSPPPLPLQLSQSFSSSPTPASASSATSTDMLSLPRSASDVTTGVGVQHQQQQQLDVPVAEEPNSSSVSRSSDFSFHRVAGAEADQDEQLVGPDSPYTPPHRPPRFIPDRPATPPSASDSLLSARSASFSSSRGASNAPVLERPISTPAAATAAAAGVVLSVGVAIDGLVKMHREDILSLRVLAKQTREPSAPIRRVVETTALLVAALQQAASTQSTATKASKVAAVSIKPSPRDKTADKGSKALSWRDLFASSSFLNTLVKCTPLTSPTQPATQPAQPVQPQQLLSVEAAATLRVAVNDALMWKVAYVRSLTPALKAVWAWVLAVCGECGVPVERAAGGESGSGSVPAGSPLAGGSGSMELSSTTSTSGSMVVLGGTGELSNDESDMVTIIGAEAVRARARSRSMEQAAPVSPAPGSPVPASPLSPTASASPSPCTSAASYQPTASSSKRSTAGAITPARRSGKLSSTLSLQPASPAPASTGSGSRSATTDKLPSTDRDTPSPHSADVRGSVGRSRAKRDALPAASTRSTGNVHLSVNAAIKVRRGKGPAADK